MAPDCPTAWRCCDEIGSPAPDRLRSVVCGVGTDVPEELKKSTGRSASELIRRGLRLVFRELGRQPSAWDLAGRSVGKFRKGPPDLARNRKHLEGFGG